MTAPPLVVFPDTNVLIQGRTLRDLPWGELDRDPIDVVICGPVIRELDRLKTRGGRAGKVARAMGTTVRELMATPVRADTLREAGPRVTRRLLLGSSVREPVRAGLDLGHDDQAIINQALAAGDAGDDVVLLTDDNFAAMTAEEHGLRTLLMPAHWLKELEADDGARELARKDAEIARLKAAEPSPGLRFADERGQPIERLEATMKRYRPVERADVDRLVERVVTAAPMAKVEPGSGPGPRTATGVPSTLPATVGEMMRTGMLGSLRPVTRAEVDAYEKEHAGWLGSIRDRIAGLHEDWNRGREWPQARLLAVNDGSRPADDVLVEIEASGSFRLSGCGEEDEPTGPRGGKDPDRLSLPLPPTPPRPRHPMESVLRSITEGSGLALGQPFRSVPNLRRDADAFYWREGRREPRDVISLECASWRHGREEEGFSWRVWADDEDDVRGLVVGRISAANLTRAVEARLPLRITFVETDTLHMAEQLVEDLACRIGIARS